MTQHNVSLDSWSELLFAALSDKHSHLIIPDALRKLARRVIHVNSVPISPRKHSVSVLIGSTSQSLLIGTHNISFYGEV